LRCATAKCLESPYDLDSIRFFRDRPVANHPFETDRLEIFGLGDVEDGLRNPRTLRLSQGGFKHELVISVEKFVSRDGDKTKHQWYVDGQKRELEMPPYCVYDLRAARRAVLQYITSSYRDYLKYVIDNSGALTREVLLQALEYCERTQVPLLSNTKINANFFQSPMVKDALQILAMNRMIERDWRIVNPETINLTPVREEGCPWNGTVPVTPTMDTALDQIVIQTYLQKLRKSVLSEIQSQIKMTKPRNCFELFLTIFILATNTQLLLQHSRANALRYQAPVSVYG
jgi:hypothetical protein